MTPFWPPRYGQTACDCGHYWQTHDVDEYPGDESEMCCVWGCNQQGCPGRKTEAHDKTTGLTPADRDAATDDTPAQTNPRKALS